MILRWPVKALLHALTPLLHGYCYTVTATRFLLHDYSMLHDFYYRVSATPLLLHGFYYTFIVPLAYCTAT